MSYPLNKRLSYLNTRLLIWSLSIPILMGTVVVGQRNSLISLALYFSVLAGLILINRKFVHILMFLAFVSIFSFTGLFKLFGFEIESVVSTVTPDGLRFANLLLWSIFLFVIIGISNFTSDIQYKNSIRIGIREIRYYLPLVGFGFMSFLWTISIEYTLRESLKLSYPLIAFLIALIIFRKGNNVAYFSNFLQKILILGILLNIGGVLYKLLNGTLFYQEGRTNITRITDFPIDIGICIFPGIFFFSYAYLNKKIRYLLPSLIVLGLLILTLTRTYIFAYIASIMYILGFSNKKLFPKIAVFLICFLLIYAFFETDNPLKTRMFWNPKAIGFEDFISKPQIIISPDVTVFSGRYNTWEATINSLHSSTSFLLGGGAGTTKYFLRDRFSMTYVHSDWVKYISELGYTGFFLYLLFLLGILFRSTRLMLSKSDLQSRIYFATTGGSIVYFLVAGFSYEVTSPIRLFYVFIFYAIGLTTKSQLATTVSTCRIYKQKN